MKKMIAIMLVLAVVMTGVFAATVTLNATIDGDLFYGVSKTSVPAITTLPAVSPYDNSANFNDAFDTPSTAYFGYVTNNTFTAVSVEAVATPFVNEASAITTNNKVGYVISGDVDLEVLKTDVSKPIDLGFTKLEDDGLRHDERTLTFTANATDVAAAAAGDYLATITFTITAS